MTKRKSAKKPARKQKETAKSKSGSGFGIGLISLFVLAGIVIGFLVYAVFIFPKNLNKNIKKDMIVFFNPVSFDDNENTLILELNARPDADALKRISDFFSSKYGIIIKISTIKSSDDSGIERINFFQEERELRDFSNIYLYWFSRSAPADLKKEFRNEMIEKLKNEGGKNLNKNAYSNNNSSAGIKTHENYIYQKSARIAIVIDDVGYDLNKTRELLDTSVPVTYSIIPDVQESLKSYDLIKKYNGEMMLHIPMEPLKGKKYVEKDALFTDMSEADLKKRLDLFLTEYPGVKGANNHMGSKASDNYRVMNVLFSELSGKNLFWLDSRTTGETLTDSMAPKYNLRFYKRNVFLDDDRDINYMRKEMDDLIKEARINGFAIGIAHNQTKNLPVILKEYYNQRNELHIEFIPLNNIK